MSPSRLILVVPGLCLPAQMLRDLSFDLPLPALRALLTDADPVPLPAESALLDALLAPGNLAAAAPLRLLGLGGSPGADAWLCLDPVHLGFRERRIVVQDPASLNLTHADARQLAADIAPLFAEFGTLQVDAPLHWHLRLLADAPDFPSLTEAISADAGIGLCPDRRWQQALNEAQMLLHGHAVNRRRASADFAPVNSLWPWGGGRLAALKRGAETLCLHTDDPCLRGLAQANGQRWAPVPMSYAQPASQLTTLIELTNARHAAASADAGAWRQALLDLEANWFTPLLAARLPAVHLICPGTHRTHCLRLRPATTAARASGPLAPVRMLWQHVRRQLRGNEAPDVLLRLQDDA